MRRWLLKTLAALVLLVAVLSLSAYLLARRSLPVVDGTVTVNGLSAPIDIVRDADAIPHIFAANKLDALFGLGYAHAQDRLWQMEFQRRIGNGRLSEIFGKATLPQDRFLRTVGFGRAAQQAWTSTPDPAKEQVNAYIAGINAFLDTHHSTQLPPEFSLLRFEPEHWSGADVIVWGKMMAWDLSMNYVFEVLRHDLSAAVGPDRAKDLMLPYAHDGLSIIEAGNLELNTHNLELELKPLERRTGPSSEFSVLSSQFREAMSGNPAVADFLLGSAKGEAIGSNNWVIDGSMTASGKPLLANDPHLGTRLPSTWYLAHMSAGDFDVIGATLPGAPAVTLGRNRFIAWGATNVGADVQDLYRERIDSATGTAEYLGAADPIQIVPETIVIKGESPVTINVRITRHGPVVSDAINANNAGAAEGRRRAELEPLAFRWTALDPDDTTIASFLKLNEARDWTGFTDALRDFVVPSQNFVYADVEGHIGYYAPGRIPIRARGNGDAPVDGWTGDNEWNAFVPFDGLPHAYDPPAHFIVTANHRPASAGYPYMLGLEWIEPYRAQRITDLLKTRGASFTPDDFAAMQRDTISLHAKTLLPVLAAHARPQDSRDRDALAMLQAWDGDARGDSAAAAIFQAWFLRLAPSLVGDELGPLLTENYQERFTFVTRFALETLKAFDSAWCDDVRTPTKESCDDIVTTALHDGVSQLTARLGSDMSRWRWDAVHRAIFPHLGLDAVSVLRPLLSRSIPNGGDWSTIDVGPVASDRPFEQRHVPGYREIIDLSPANDSRFLIDVGQSGHPLSPHYDDFLRDWQAVKHRPMRMDRGEIEDGAIGTLRLRPQ